MTKDTKDKSHLIIMSDLNNDIIDMISWRWQIKIIKMVIQECKY